jgi:hypothetical protein
MDDPHPDFRVFGVPRGWMDGWRILIWILGFRSPERLDGWRILVLNLGFWSPRDRDDEEDLKKSSVVGERERERVLSRSRRPAQFCDVCLFSRLQYLLCICVTRKKTFQRKKDRSSLL